MLVHMRRKRNACEVLSFDAQHVVDVTEIFRELPREKKLRMIKLALYVFIFVVVIYK